MVQIAPFEVEQWMDAYETTPGVLNVAETCAASLSIDELAALAEAEAAGSGGGGDDATRETVGAQKRALMASLAATRLTYGAIRGSPLLRQRVATLYRGVGVQGGADEMPGQPGQPGRLDLPSLPDLPSDGVVVTQGAIAANHLVFYALVGPGDHVICVYPTYKQLYAVPASLGAEVSLWRLNESDGYVPDVGQLAGLVRPNTKMIVINNPNNPTGAPIPRPVLERIIAFARARKLFLLSDEVYLPLFHGGASSETTSETTTTTAAAPPSVLALTDYDRAIATGSMSKAFALAGLRVGWAASRGGPAVVQPLLAARDYTTISVSQLDDAVAAFALSEDVRRPLLRRNRVLARTNVQLLHDFVQRWQWPRWQKEPASITDTATATATKTGVCCSWTPPTAGTTAFVRFQAVAQGGASPMPLDDEQLCLHVLQATQVLLVPGSRCFGGSQDFRGFVRFGYVCETAVLAEALQRLDSYLQTADIQRLTGDN